MIRVRLVDVPLPVRLSAAQKVCAKEPAPDLRAEVMAAAFFPSPRTYLVGDDARPIWESFIERKAA